MSSCAVGQGEEHGPCGTSPETSLWMKKVVLVVMVEVRKE